MANFLAATSHLLGVGVFHSRNTVASSECGKPSRLEPQMPMPRLPRHAPGGPAGLPVANLPRDTALLRAARDEALAWLEEDPELSRPELAALRAVLAHRWQGRLGLARVG